MTPPYVPPCRGCLPPYHSAGCPHYDSAHDPPGLWQAPTDSPFAGDAMACSDCGQSWRRCECSDLPVAPDYGFPADEYDLREETDHEMG